MSDNADQNARAPLAGSADPDKVATSPAPHSPGAAPMREMKALSALGQLACRLRLVQPSSGSRSCCMKKARWEVIA